MTAFETLLSKHELKSTNYEFRYIGIYLIYYIYYILDLMGFPVDAWGFSRDLMVRRL